MFSWREFRFAIYQFFEIFEICTVCFGRRRVKPKKCDSIYVKKTKFEFMHNFFFSLELLEIHRKMFKSSLRLVSSGGQFLARNGFSTTPRLTVSLSQLDRNKPPSELSASDVILPKNASTQRAEGISRAMAYYLEKVAKRESVMKVKTAEYEIGKRHLAKMMGENPDTFTQAEIDVPKIEYIQPFFFLT